MKLTTKCRYGTRALIEIARNYLKGETTKRKEISLHQDVPESYLENILTALKNHGLVATVRGPKGGFSLRKPPEAITMLEVVTALQGSLSPVDCLEEGNDCSRCQQCDTRGLWMKLKEAQEKVLSATTLLDLANGPRNASDAYMI